MPCDTHIQDVCPTLFSKGNAPKGGGGNILAESWGFRVFAPRIRGL